VATACMGFQGYSGNKPGNRMRKKDHGPIDCQSGRLPTEHPFPLKTCASHRAVDRRVQVFPSPLIVESCRLPSPDSAALKRGLPGGRANRGGCLGGDGPFRESPTCRARWRSSHSHPR
jgi:hypothetical protein